MNWQKTSLVFIVTMALAGCSAPRPTVLPTSAAPAETPTPAITVIPVQEPTQTLAATAAAATPTTAPSALPSPSLAPTGAVFTPFKATASVDALKLRTGPGTLFPARIQLAMGAELTVLGRSTGNEWAYVRTADGIQGWVFVLLVKTEKDLQSAPGVEPGDAQIVRGRVTDPAGKPVNGVQFALVNKSATTAPRTDATTDANGDFYMFLPPATTGEWTLSYAAIACTSRVMDASCNCQGGSCGTSHPESVQVVLPQTQPLAFTWK